MKNRSVNKKINLLNDKEDKRALLRSTVEWFIFVAAVLAAAVILLNTVFRLYSFEADGKTIYTVVSTSGYDVGDIVYADGQCRYVIAVSGEILEIGSDKIQSFETFRYKNQLYQKENVSEILRDEKKVPKGYVLSVAIDSESNTADFIKEDQIAGKTEFVVHPFIDFGKTVDDVIGG